MFQKQSKFENLHANAFWWFFQKWITWKQNKMEGVKFALDDEKKLKQDEIWGWMKPRNDPMFVNCVGGS